MKCPRCESEALDERDRDGIVIDVCKSCRGLWLDRGELEKLIARATRDLDELVEPPRGAPPPREPERAPPPDRAYQEQRHRDSTPPRGVRYDDGRGYYDDDRRYHRRKKSWIESLGDIFD
jgi:Zn-finger nucleic acid-binding protein